LTVREWIFLGTSLALLFALFAKRFDELIDYLGLCPPVDNDEEVFDDLEDSNVEDPPHHPDKEVVVPHRTNPMLKAKAQSFSI